MKLTPAQRRLIERVVNVFETGRPEGDYSAVALYNDGPHDIRQITYGRSQTTEYGNLRSLIRDYAAAGSDYSAALTRYAEIVGSRPLAADREFIALLRRCGADPVMRKLQDRLFDRKYYTPALQWCTAHGLTLPLSALVVYDSYIHSGSMLWVIRESFPETLPVDGGGERTWIAAYVRARARFLSTHRRAIVRRTTYRPRFLLSEIERGNWDLSIRPMTVRGVGVG